MDTNNSNSCCMTASTCSPGCCKKTGLLAMLVAFVAMMAFDWLFHGVLLKSVYEQSAALWRPEAERMAMWPYCLVLHLVMAGVFTCLYGSFCGANDGVCPVKKGVKLGCKVGLLLGLAAAGTYIGMPLTMDIALGWFFGNLLKMIVAGAAIGMVYKAKFAKQQ